MEYDEYDEHSCHYLIQHKETKSYMATTRLILPNSKIFPMEAHSKIDNLELIKTVPRANLAELSRFCVSKQFRRRANERDLIVTNDSNGNRNSPREKNNSASITLSLFACAINMSIEHDIHYWYAIMEPALKRVVFALGVDFVEVGPLVDYHGMRLPCIIKVDDLLRSVAKKDLDYWTMITNNGQFNA
jgi:N-acyl amino acid synthase of PEP-CTERM/exosortase system